MLLANLAANFPAIILGFREGLEAFLLVVVLLQYFKRRNDATSEKTVLFGANAAVLISVIIAFSVSLFNDFVAQSGQWAKVFEILASFVGLGFITYFIIWMVKEGPHSTTNLKQTIAQKTSQVAIFFLAFSVVFREGVEIGIFVLAGRYDVLFVLIGAILSLLLTVAIYWFSWKIRLRLIMQLTIYYLIFQAGFLLGYGVHEGLSLLKDFGWIAPDSFLLIKAFDLSGTILDHTNGLLGVILYALIGYYSKPEWIQFLVNVVYVASLSAWTYRQFGLLIVKKVPTLERK